ncbi:hypothetical protein BAMA111019_08965 [Bacillus manliponensis]
MKDDEIGTLLKRKNGGEEFETIIRNGKYETFKYIY